MQQARCCFEERTIAAFPEDRYPNERAADSHIKRLRKKLSLAADGKDPIETVYGMGYRFTDRETIPDPAPGEKR